MVRRLLVWIMVWFRRIFLVGTTVEALPVEEIPAAARAAADTNLPQSPQTESDRVSPVSDVNEFKVPDDWKPHR